MDKPIVFKGWGGVPPKGIPPYTYPDGWIKGVGEVISYEERGG